VNCKLLSLFFFPYKLKKYPCHCNFKVAQVSPMHLKIVHGFHAPLLIAHALPVPVLASMRLSYQSLSDLFINKFVFWENLKRTPRNAAAAWLPCIGQLKRNSYTNQCCGKTSRSGEHPVAVGTSESRHIWELALLCLTSCQWLINK